MSEEDDERPYMLAMTDGGAVYFGEYAVGTMDGYMKFRQARKLFIWSNTSLIDIAVNGIKNGKVSEVVRVLHLYKIKECLVMDDSAVLPLMAAEAHEWINKEEVAK